MFLAPHVKYDGLVVLVSRNGDHTGLAVVSVHGYRCVASVLKSIIMTKIKTDRNIHWTWERTFPITLYQTFTYITYIIYYLQYQAPGIVFCNLLMIIIILNNYNKG